MKKVLIFMAGLLLIAANLYAGSGDLIVDGNLGVGTAGPDEKMVVNGELGVGEVSGVPVAQFQGYPDPESGNNGGTLYIKTRNGGTGVRDTRMTIKYNGNIGIGTTDPKANLHVAKNDGASDAVRAPIIMSRYWASDTDIRAAAIYNYFNSVTGNDQLVLGVSGGGSALTSPALYSNAKMVIQGNGNVGIGTTTPGYKLDVAGQIASSDGQVQVSDLRFKKNLNPIQSALSKVTKLKGVSYNWRTDEFKNKGFSDGKHYGVIAQEVERVLPEIVKEDHNGDKAVAYTEIIPVLIEAIKEQQKIIEDQKALAMEQQKEITALKAGQQAMKKQQAMISALFVKVNELERRMQLKSTMALADN